MALQKAQTTAIYAGLQLWPSATTAALVRSQLVEDGTYPGATAAFEAADRTDAILAPSKVADYDPAQPRDDEGRWTSGGGAAASSASAAPASVSKPTSAVPVEHGSSFLSTLGSLLGGLNPIGTAQAQEADPEEENRGLLGEMIDPTAEVRIARYNALMVRLRAIDPKNPELVTLTPPGYVPSNEAVARVEAAAEAASIKRVQDFVMPGGIAIGEPGDRYGIRELPGGLSAAQKDFTHLSVGGTLTPFSKGQIAKLPGSAGFVVLRPVTSSPSSPAIDINVPGVPIKRLHY